MLVRLIEGVGMSITASEARRSLFPLIEQVNEDRTVVEIVSRRGNAVLMSADDYAALAETAYLLRSPENARRLLTAYTDALAERNLTGRDLHDLEIMTERA
jgi:antitoxin YefM